MLGCCGVNDNVQQVTIEDHRTAPLACDISAAATLRPSTRQILQEPLAASEKNVTSQQHHHTDVVRTGQFTAKLMAPLLANDLLIRFTLVKLQKQKSSPSKPTDAEVTSLMQKIAILYKDGNLERDVAKIITKKVQSRDAQVMMAWTVYQCNGSDNEFVYKLVRLGSPESAMKLQPNPFTRE
ncbi:hypothetical protein GUITHDRAFT_100736 [Guillardia theta CCMP2712]|uniref:Uncharacterized protein n=1 Tax=Guillardia theta (strain CCMP2712) TaxID=905079 RepID=L1JYY0_GUITC|nr:hypothetical protein GUITHDRAFT_100736 [Guillardia theta CCMP2712]EKX53766.1 hypothetical protein GUITHDRAFT_100736 [Guillardia theta CCMP2712]|eukprot:XP_005840746.1 hypothetical protein GUITHDRAFT_100736 [Guillardia theta CCMP2712]